MTHRCPNCDALLRLRVGAVLTAEGIYTTPRQAAAEVATRHGLSLAALRKPNRSARFVEARAEAMRAARDAGATIREIGDIFDRDHSTVLYALRRNEGAVAA